MATIKVSKEDSPLSHITIQGNGYDITINVSEYDLDDLENTLDIETEMLDQLSEVLLTLLKRRRKPYTISEEFEPFIVKAMGLKTRS